MFDLSWGEMGIIAVVALVVLGPKELPNALRTMSMLMKNARKLAGEFQSGVNEIIREADLDEARKKLQEVPSLNKNQIEKAVEKAIDPTGEVKSALTAPDDPTGPPRTEVKPAIESGAIEPDPVRMTRWRLPPPGRSIRRFPSRPCRRHRPIPM